MNSTLRPSATACHPHGGFGLGAERLIKQMLDLPNIREVILFPRDRRRLTP
ncbi:amino acid--tRNA ligase-related protein [Thermococcus peptonophilus]|uniref:amino acid--tRNA ligase-related protein n=1 Tax=Thermococcus peptonophilus TaxID=53952 RepID=UPI0034670BA4